MSEVKRCDECGCVVEKIKYVSDKEPESYRREVYHPNYRHRNPHVNCPCPRPNMTVNQTR